MHMLKEGYLEKWTNYLTQWKKRYFVLSGSVLSYFIQKGDVPKGRIHLAISTIHTSDDPMDLKFQIDTGLTIIYLKAEDKDTKNEWMASFKSARAEIERISYETKKTLFEGGQFTTTVPEEYVSPKIKNCYEAGGNAYTNKIKAITSLFIDIKNNEKKISLIAKEREVKDLISSNEQKLEQIEMILINFSSHLKQFFSECDKIKEFINNDDEAFQFNREEGIEKAKNSQKREAIQFFDQEIACKPPNDDQLMRDSEIFFEATPDIKINENIHSENIIDESEYDSEDMDEDKKMISQTVFPRFYDVCYKTARSNFPIKRTIIKYSIWSLLKDVVGKDLSRITFPAYINEPIGMLQRICENFQYGDMLTKASLESNRFIRLAYLACFSIGSYAVSPKRTLKFFNPLLGETFEYVDNRLNIRFFSEQVSHHPPISAFFAEGEYFSLYGNTNSKANMRLMANTLEFIPLSKSYITLKKFNEIISYVRPICAVKNLMGSNYVDCYGTFNVNNHTTGDFAEIQITEANEKEQGNLKGVVKNSHDEIELLIEGNWLQSIDIIHPITKERKTIWKRFPGDDEDKYYFTEFGINLNNITPQLKKILPRTDSRLRPDQRALENQDYTLASEEKHRLEEKQRAVRREMEISKKIWKPHYFTESYDDLSGELVYLYTRDYWKDRSENKFSHLDDIF